ncbi:hypothetical protein TL5118_01053 [Thalassovita autumnalis]|uniref:Uncharacterized protein n=1 Tax=Thalassovita autumnalis TaxID=2072972 RepID=A0A0P1FT15_9RHOB|nr:DUF1778 domain-containing protein [Thalassovita autumnalis]CUH64883.1 hypothetical protein TL5118_01053 [Thalassovita autumnalis]CUH71729.1 hypothetical protein TL5120_01519 [Thalassovita autumnalis]
MLSMVDPQIDEANDLTTQIRHGSTMKDKIETAAAVLGVNKSVFLRWAVNRQCAQIIKEQQSHKLTAEDAAAFSAALDAPIVVSERAAKSARSFAVRVVHAD